MTATSDPLLDRLGRRILAIHGGTADPWREHWNLTEGDSLLHKDARDALATVLEPLSVVPTEPVAWRIRYQGDAWVYTDVGTAMPYGREGWEIESLYAHPAVTSLVPSSGETQASGA